MNLEVLIVEDDEIIALIHENWVKKSGISSSPLTFFNGNEAHNYLLSHSQKDTEFLILLDINMPVMNGWEFLEKINEDPVMKNVYVVIVTSSITQTDKGKSMNYSQVIDFVEKPINQETCSRIKSLSLLSRFFKS